MRGRRISIAVVCCALAAGCAGSDEPVAKPPPADLERLTLSGVSFGIPERWSYCEFPGPVVFGRLVQAEPESWGAGAPPLTVQVNKGVESYEEALELDVLALGAGADVSTEEVEVPGASEATMRRYEGNVLGQDFGGMLVFAHDGDETSVKVAWTSLPEDVDDGEAAFDAVVDSIEFGADRDDSEFETCDEPAGPTPRPPPEHTEDVPGEVAGTYEMTITHDQLDESKLLTAKDATEWTLILQGDELEALGKTDTGSFSFSIPILEASTTQLVLEGDDCDDPLQPMEMTMSFDADGDSLEILDLEPACDPALREIFTLNVWRRRD